MRFHTVIGLAAAWICSAMVSAEEPELGPEVAFFKGLQKLEQQYINAMREKALKAASVEVLQIGGKRTETNLLESVDKNVFFTIDEDESTYKLLILQSGKTAKKPAEIKAWADAVLPAEEQPFAMCIPDYGFGVRFLDPEGREIYSTRICLKCSSSDVSYPRYNSRLGFDPKVVRQLIKNSGLTVPDQK